MSGIPYRLVLDTNIIVRGLINLQSASGRILSACERRQVIPILSKPILTEYRLILQRPAILHNYPEISRPDVKDALERLLFVGDYYRKVGVRFSFTRDPKDAPFLELSIAASASHLITTDADMLELAVGRDDAAKRFRQRAATKILKPEEFIADHPGAIAAKY